MRALSSVSYDLVLPILVEELNHSLDENKKEIVQMSGKDAELVDKSVLGVCVIYRYMHHL